MKRNPSTILFAALLAPCAITFLYGQSASGGVNGTVTDPARAAIPGATVVLRNTATNIETTASTNASGLFTFVNVQPGPYTLTVKTTGFKSAQAELIQQSSAELGTVISQKAVQDLPLNGRNFTLTPGATPVTTSQATIGNNDGNTVALPQSGFSNPSIHGQWNRSSVYFLDGIIDTDFQTTTYTILPEVDLIQEFKVQSHNDKSEYGGVAGGIINVVSKSGTNELARVGLRIRAQRFTQRPRHFGRRQAHRPIPVPSEPVRGDSHRPISRNKTFFSGGYDGWRYTKPVGTLLRVPTGSRDGRRFFKIHHRVGYLRSGHKSQNAISGQHHSGQPCFVDGPGFVKTYFAPPNYSDPVFNAIASKPQVNSGHGWHVKVDHQINAANSAWFRYSAMNAEQITPTNNVQGNSFVMNAKNFGGRIIHIFSPALILDVRGGYAARPFTITAYHDVPLNAATKLGFVGLDQFAGATVGLATPWGNCSVLDPQPRGNHNLKTGFQYIQVSRITQSDGVSYIFADDGTASPLLLGKSGASLASAMLGLPASCSGTRFDASRTNFDFATWDADIQDEWKVAPRITPAGLRFDHVNHVNLNNVMDNGPNLATGNWEIGGGVLPPPCTQAGIAPCIPGNGLKDAPFSEHIVVAADKDRWRNARWNEFGPRLSLAWRITAKTVLRTGYGLFFDALPARGQTYDDSLNLSPYRAGFSNTANVIGSSPVRIEDLHGPSPSCCRRRAWTINTTFYSAPNREDARSHQWNLEIQRQLSETMVVSAAYVGSANKKVDVNGLANTAITPGPGTAAQVNP